MSGMLSDKDIRLLMKSEHPLIENAIDFDIQIQPNGIDMTLKSVSKLEGVGQIDFDNSERQLSNQVELNFSNDYVLLTQGYYVVKFNEIVHMPANVAALGKTRSSLLRCGASLQTAVWDAGYSGRSESLLLVSNSNGIKLKKNARIMQLIFFCLENESSELYSGIYQNENI